jgi:hypothetical protein
MRCERRDAPAISFLIIPPHRKFYHDRRHQQEPGHRTLIAQAMSPVYTLLRTYRCGAMGLGCVWQGDQGMRIMIVAFALGTALLSNLPTFNVAAQAQNAKVVREQRERPLVRVPIVKTTPYWDYYIVPRYRYRAEDDRVDPCGGPVVPVIRYGPQEETVPLWQANAWGLGRVHGRDWPCKGQSR